jgi:DNA (cytosine-5)-methyltransferase 1
VLKQRYGHVKNYGDLTRWKEWGLEPGSVDVLVGGPPCQAFSVAGLRQGMADPRGNLSLVYFGLVNHLKPRWVIYENVPGLLSARGGSDFSALLSALAECGYGFAYRMLDAANFSLAQRRKRIFLVGFRDAGTGVGDWRPPSAVLFDGKSVFGNPPTKSRKGKGVASPTGEGVDSDGLQTTVGTLCADTHPGAYSGQDAYTGRLIPARVSDGGVAGLVDPRPVIVDRAAYNQGINAQYNTFIDHTDLCPTIIAKGPHAVQPPQQVLYENHPNDSRVTSPLDIAPTVAARFGTGGGNVPFVQNISGMAIPIDTRNVTRDPDKKDEMNRQGVGVGADGDPCHTLTSSHVNAVAFQPGNLVRRAGSDPSTEVFPTLSKDSGDQNPHVAVNMAVRRLTPEECEALQGFERGHTKISWKGKPADQCPDGPRYKAIGNSMATTCMRFIGQRIVMVEEALSALPRQG